jgi:hypothetical protein
MMTDRRIIASIHGCKKVFHRRDAAFAAAASLSPHAHACFAVHPSWFVFWTLCAHGVSAVRFCSEADNYSAIVRAYFTAETQRSQQRLPYRLTPAHASPCIHHGSFFGLSVRPASQRCVFAALLHEPA